MTLQFNPILAVDSYKFSHAYAYPENIVGMFSYIEPRTNGRDIMIPFGLQMWLKKFMTVQITLDHINEAEAFAAAHGEPFKKEAWLKVISEYNGFLPLVIRAVPEGTPVRSGNALVTVKCEDPDLFWLCSYIETAILRAVWYPTTIASMDHLVKKEIKRFYEISGADMGMLPFSLHDFGGRGVTSAEQAEVGGAAHLVNFMGSDTVEGIRAANYYYNEPMAGFSVPATEHSVECSFGKSPEQELQYLRHVISALGKEGGIVSIVIDGYDVYRCAEQLCTTLHDEIVASKCKVVFRPDSGDMLEVIPRILRLQAKCFGTTVNKAGYLKINHVGLLQGDGVDHLAIKTLLGNILAMKFAADNVVFGSGGALLQKVNRDTYKFAMKASAVLVKTLVDDEIGVTTTSTDWVGIAKDPITDPGKKSKEGVLTLVRSKMTGQLQTARIDLGLNEEFEDIMVTVYDHGFLLNETTLVEIRARAAV
jgi:nicotinamide phosphoribosyltransferase